MFGKNEVFSRLLLQSNKNHIQWIDVAKGLGVFLVFYGHLMYESSVPEINQLIYAFHTSFFFILSGFVFNVKSETRFFSFLKDKVIRLLIPLFFFMLAGVLVAKFFYDVNDPVELIKLFFYYDGKFYYNAPCWFFISLFEIWIISFFLNIPKMDFRLKLGLWILLLIVGFGIYRQEQYVDSITGSKTVVILFGVDKTVISFSFFVFGSLFKNAYSNIKSENRIVLLKPILLPSFVIFFTFALLNPRVSLYGMSLYNYWYFIITSVSGSVLFFIISLYISKIKPLVFIFSQWARNSVFIIGTHYIARIGFVAWYLGETGSIHKTPIYDLYTPLYVLGILTIYTIVCPLLDMVVPFVTGKKPYFYEYLFGRNKRSSSNN